MFFLYYHAKTLTDNVLLNFKFLFLSNLWSILLICYAVELW